MMQVDCETGLDVQRKRYDMMYIGDSTCVSYGIVEAGKKTKCASGS